MSDDDTKQPVILSRGLTKIFKDFWRRPKAKAVNDIDFDVNQGEILGMLGPNGSGKSTTVKMILGLLYPTQGELRVFGRSPRDVKTKARIGYLPEESYLYKYLSAFETLDFFGALFEMDRATRRRRAGQLLEMVGLNHARDRQIGEFSKGMARRIGLAQAMINDPDLLILDEPTSGLDPLGCREVKDLLLHLKSRGKTIVVCSHLLGDVEDVCDRVVILYGGKIHAHGTLKELLTVPDESRITTPMLSAELTERVLKILRENLKGEEFKIDKPRMSLEAFFLNVVHQARAQSAETFGVGEAGEIAEYLRDQNHHDNPNPPAKPPEQALDEILAEKNQSQKSGQTPDPKTEPATEHKPKTTDPKTAAILQDEPDPNDQPKDKSGEKNPSIEEKLDAADDKLDQILHDK